MPVKSLKEAVEKGLTEVKIRNPTQSLASDIIRYEVIDYLAHLSMHFSAQKSVEIQDAMVEFFDKVRGKNDS